MSATSSIDVYLGPHERWVKARDYQRFAYINFKETTDKLLQKYYVEKGFFYNKMIGKIYPGIKKIEKKDAAAAQENLLYGNVIFTMKREPLRTNSTKNYMYYMITEDDKHVPITDDPQLKALHEEEERSKKTLNDEIKMKRRKWDEDGTKQSSLLDDKIDEVDEVGGVVGGVVVGNLGYNTNGGKRKTKQKRTNKNKRHTRQTRRYFKR
jgi:hypothetical protein